MNHETQRLPTEQTYFMAKVTNCYECPFIPVDDGPLVCGKAQMTERRVVFVKNNKGITPTCPMWAQRVQPEPPKD